MITKRKMGDFMIKIEKMTKEDIDGILEVENSSFSVPWTRGSFEGEIKNSRANYLVAKIDEKIVGYVGVWIILDEGHITNVAVHKDYRSQKIGDKLVSEIINLCKEKNVVSITLEVRSSNTIAQNLYKKYGFTFAGIRKEYYSDNKEDALLMWKDV